ncbi:hypothetical protein INR49_016764 [Caranx melampygus]|nr:hypothetical protein INR49_016764 [Caranx melampygus]
MPRKGRRAQAAKLRWRKPKQEQLPSQSPQTDSQEPRRHNPPAPDLQLTTSLEHHSQVHSSGGWMMCVPTFVHVFVVDFPLRLDCEVSYQDLLRQEYHRISARMGSAQTRVAQEQVEECFFPLNPVWFSSTALHAMEEVSPSHLSCPVDYQPSPKHNRVASSASARRPRATARPPRHRSPVNNLVGSPPSRLSWSSEEAPSSLTSVAQTSQTVSPVRRPWTKDGHPSGSRPPVNNLVGTPPTRLSLSAGDAATPCCSPAAKMARTKTPSPTVPSWTIADAGCNPPSPAKTAQSPVPSSSSWPWFISDPPSTSRSPANEWMTSVPTAKMQTKLLVPTSSITKEDDHRSRKMTSRGPELKTATQQMTRTMTTDLGRRGPNIKTASQQKTNNMEDHHCPPA